MPTQNAIVVFAARIAYAIIPANTLDQMCFLDPQQMLCDPTLRALGPSAAEAKSLAVWLTVFGVVTTVISLWLFIHAVRHREIAYRGVWITALVIGGFFAAVPYFFAVWMPTRARSKRPIPTQVTTYVQQMRQAGADDDAIRRKLSAAKWETSDIERALRA